MNFTTLSAAAAIALAATCSISFAGPVTFEFSFGVGADSITGTIEGLDTNGLNQQADGVTVNGKFGTYDLDLLLVNKFDITDGIVDLLTLDLHALREISGEVFELVLYLEVEQYGWNEGDTGFELEYFGGFTAESLNFSIGPASNIVSTVPLPAGGLMLLSGLAGITGLTRRKSRS